MGCQGLQKAVSVVQWRSRYRIRKHIGVHDKQSSRKRQEKEGRGRLAQGPGRFEPVRRGLMKSKGPNVPE